MPELRPPAASDGPPSVQEAGPALPDVAIAGPVANEEELASVQQIALITRWMRFFTAVTAPSKPLSPQP